MPLLHLQLLERVQAGPADGSGFPASLQQPRKLAVLAYLALEDRAVPRSELATVLWGDNSDESARASLRQVLHAIRSDCGFDPFIADRSCVSLKHGYVVCDVVELYRALEQNAPTGVMAQFNRAFMPGFVIAGASAFDEWCERQRNRFDITVADTAWNAADRCGDARTERNLLEIAARRRPLDQSILRRRMRCLQQLGEVGEALSLYDAHRNQLREQTGASPAKETNDLAHELLNAARSAVVVPADALHAGAATASEPRGLRAYVQGVRKHLQRHGGRLVGAAVLIVAMYVGFYVSTPSEATSGDIPVVMLQTLTISGADPVRSDQIRELLSTLLSEDEQFALSRTNARASDAVLSLSLDVSDGVRGTATLLTPPGTLLARMPIISPAHTDVAIADLARQIRRLIKVELARDEESRNEAALDFRFEDVSTLMDAGAFAQAASTLDEIDVAIDRDPLYESSRRMLRSRWWEWRSWLSIGRDRDFAAALDELAAAIEVLEQNPDDPGARQRLMNLNFGVVTLDTLDRRDALEQIELHATAIPNSDRSDDTWVRLAQAQYHLGKYQEALGTGDVGRRISHTLAIHRELGPVMFDAAFELDHAKRADYECRMLRDRRPTEWQSIVCAAQAMGWLNADYDARELLAELKFIENTEPARSQFQKTGAEFIAAAAARKGDRALADSLLRTLPEIPADNFGKMARAATYLALGRSADAETLQEELRATPGGRRTLNSHARLLKP